MFASSFGLIVLAMPLAAAADVNHAMLDRLAAEAETLKAEQPKRWKEYQEKTEHVFADNDKLVAHWQKRSNPPAPDLTPLQLPLAFLADALRHEQSLIKPQGKVHRGQSPFRRQLAFLTAIVHSTDERLLPFLLEYQEQYPQTLPQNWSKLLADAATVKWAAAQIVALARKDPPFLYDRRFEHLLYCLIDRFARELPADAEKAAYAYLRKQTPDGPRSDSGEKIWDVLFRLDARRAGKEILPYFTQPSGAKLRYNYHVVVLLAQHPAPSPEVAAAVRTWLATQTDLSAFNREQLREVLSRADPNGQPGPAAK